MLFNCALVRAIVFSLFFYKSIHAFTNILLLTALGNKNSQRSEYMRLSSWTAEGLSQEELMHKDECILVDKNDIIIGHDSKYNCHLFTTETPEGKLHRAFSVLIFNLEGNKILLQKRADNKKTFPGVWTNACCSHPLYGYQPNEVDTSADIIGGLIPGIRFAAIRKLQHELGINSSNIPMQSLKYLTRILYASKDLMSAHNSSGVNPDIHYWGENEIDYILFLRGDFELSPNVEEISEVRYVDKHELKKMLDPSSGCSWSPWFRMLATCFLDSWWENIDETFNTDKFVDLDNIHYLK